MTRPRAADDFPSIRARMVELGREHARPPAADDSAMIRARMEAYAASAPPKYWPKRGAFR